jgi:peptide/nickel transport system substrate-binding protein
MKRLIFTNSMIYLGGVLLFLLLLVGCASQQTTALPATETSQATEMPDETVLLASETPSPAPTTNLDEAYLVTPGRLAVRAGPGFEYGDPLTALSPNTTAAILGMSIDSDWWQIECPVDIVSPSGCWVRRDPLYFDAYNIQSVPVVLSPPTSTPPNEPRTLTICQGAEPDTLFIYGGAMLAQSQILQAIYDGPIDTRGYDYQPVILEKLPSLADGDAVIEAVPVRQGDRVLNDAGVVVALQAGEIVRPFGCNRSDCAIAWDGSSMLVMAQLSATFTLLEGVRWSDGEPLTAADSHFSYQVALECQETGQCYPRSITYTNLIERTASYVVLDTLSTLWSGVPGFLDPNYRTNFFHPLPEHQIGHLSIERMVNDPLVIHRPLGWGPYAIKEYRPGEIIKLIRNPYYFRTDEGLPRFDQLNYWFTGSSLENLSAIVSGKCDIVELEASTKSVDDEHMGMLFEMEANGQLKAYFTTGTTWEHADFSIGHADYDDGYQAGTDRPDLFGDVRTRQAIALCMDRQRLVDELLHGKSSVPDTYLPQEHPLYNPNAAHYDFDPEAGSALLEQVGWIDEDGDPATPRVARGVPNVPDGMLLSFSYRTTTAVLRQQVTQILAESLALCGIQVSPEYLPAAEFFADPPEGDLFSRRFDMAVFAWLTGANPPCELFTSDNIPGDPEVLNADAKLRFPKGWKGQNNSGYSNPEYDQVCWAGKEALPEMAEYVENHLQAQEIFARDLPVIPLFLRIKFAISRPDLCGLIIDPTSNSELWNLENFDYGEGCK